MPSITRTKTTITIYEITHVVVNFSVFDETWRRIRGRFSYKGFECYNCHKHFEDGDSIGLIFTNRGNKTVCTECGIKFDAELKTEAGDPQ
jgi:hypothetical protein